MIDAITDDTGNCYAASIASITGIAFDQLRAEIGPPETWNREQERYLNNRMVDLLHERGWAILFTGPRIPRGLSVATGPSPRGDWGHCWVALDGKPYFDPHPSRAFTVKVDQYEVLVPILGLLPEDHPR